MFKKLLIVLLGLSLSTQVSFAAAVGTNYTTADLNIRLQPSATAQRIGYFKKGQEVSVEKILGNWCEVRYRRYLHAYAYCPYLKGLSSEKDFSSQETGDTQLRKPQKGDTVVTLETDLGKIKFRLFVQEVPEMSKNFRELAQQGKYENVPFHRVVKDFIIQSGDFENQNGTGGYSYKGPQKFLSNEINPTLHHLYGTISMAKTSDPISIGSQFFIVMNKEGTPFLDGQYSVFGQVYEGMEVAEAIANLQKAAKEQPSKVVNIKKITIEEYK